jgi:hypothetical protein
MYAFQHALPLDVIDMLLTHDASPTIEDNDGNNAFYFIQPTELPKYLKYFERCADFKGHVRPFMSLMFGSASCSNSSRTKDKLFGCSNSSMRTEPATVSAVQLNCQSTSSISSDALTSKSIVIWTC